MLITFSMSVSVYKERDIRDITLRKLVEAAVTRKVT